jgi:hypothetical protein
MPVAERNALREARPLLRLDARSPIALIISVDISANEAR